MKKDVEFNISDVYNYEMLGLEGNCDVCYDKGTFTIDPFEMVINGDIYITCLCSSCLVENKMSI